MHAGHRRSPLRQHRPQRDSISILMSRDPSDALDHANSEIANAGVRRTLTVFGSKPQQEPRADAARPLPRADRVTRVLVLMLIRTGTLAWPVVEGVERKSNIGTCPVRVRIAELSSRGLQACGSSHRVRGLGARARAGSKKSALEFSFQRRLG